MYVPNLFMIKGKDMSIIYVLDIDVFSSKDIFTNIQHVSKKRRQQVYNCRRNEDAYRLLVGDLLVRYILCTNLQCYNHQLRFQYNKYGKPYLATHSNCFFNLSHSESYVTCIVDEMECGIDIERMSAISEEYIDIAKLYFSNEEFSTISKMTSDEDKRAYFYILWTMKEAYLKALGVGLEKDLSSVQINLESYGNISIYDVETKDDRNLLYRSYQIHDYQLSLVAYSEPEFIYLTDIELLKSISKSTMFKVE